MQWEIPALVLGAELLGHDLGGGLVAGNEFGLFMGNPGLFSSFG